MDCTKLKADIERLREARDAFDEAVSAALDTGLGKIKCDEVMKQTSELEDEILRTYMEDVRKHNPELFRSFRYGEKIDGFRDAVYSTLKLSDNEVLACGGSYKRGRTCILRKSEDGSWNYDSEKIDGFRDAVYSTLKLSDNEVLVCGNDGGTRILRKGEDGLWNYDGNSIDGFGDSVKSTLRLSDNEVLVCGGNGETRILRKGEDGLWNYDSNSIDGFGEHFIFSTTKLSDSEVLVCSNDGETRILHIDIGIDLDKLKQKLPDIAAKKDGARTI